MQFSAGGIQQFSAGGIQRRRHSAQEGFSAGGMPTSGEELVSRLRSEVTQKVFESALAQETAETGRHENSTPKFIGHGQFPMAEQRQNRAVICMIGL